METTATMPSAQPTAPAQPTVQSAKVEDHWFVQVVGGVALANTMVGALAMFWLIMQYGVFA